MQKLRCRSLDILVSLVAEGRECLRVKVELVAVSRVLHSDEGIEGEELKV